MKWFRNSCHANYTVTSYYGYGDQVNSHLCALHMFSMFLFNNFFVFLSKHSHSRCVCVCEFTIVIYCYSFNSITQFKFTCIIETSSKVHIEMQIKRVLGKNEFWSRTRINCASFFVFFTLLWSVELLQQIRWVVFCLLFYFVLVHVRWTFLPTIIIYYTWQHSPNNFVVIHLFVGAFRISIRAKDVIGWIDGNLPCWITQATQPTQ